MTGSNLLLSSLKEYYENESNFNQLSIVLNNNKISLRVIDWFVTNYSKKFNIQYELYRKNNGDITLCENDDMYYKTLNVFTSYKSQLKSYSKRYFDPFCRRNRIEYSNNHGLIQTTIGQLNFFKWAINNHIIKFVIKNYKNIECDMNTSITTNNKDKIKGERKPRKELSKSSYRGLTKNNSKVIVRFD